jgi:hypothetical protein
LVESDGEAGVIAATIKTLRALVEEKLDEIGLHNFDFTNVTIEWENDVDAWRISALMVPSHRRIT